MRPWNFVDRLDARTRIQLNLNKSAIHSILPERDAAFLARMGRYARTFKLGKLDSVDAVTMLHMDPGWRYGGGIPVDKDVFVSS